MAVSSFSLKKLSAFSDVELPLVPGINVLLGANSTGKTHVLKWLYATLKTFERPLSSGDEPRALLKQRLAGVFLPQDRRVGRLVRRRQGVSSGKLRILGDEGEIAYSLNSKDRLTGLVYKWAPRASTVFLPSRETLAMYEGFVAAYENRELSFDETYYDICVALSASAVRGRRGVLADSLLTSVREALGGDVRLKGERFYVVFDTATHPDLEAHLVAEGLRKLASLARLIQNGSLLQRGLLVWDEPESSLNPRLVVVVARILRDLAAAGVQVVLATHDYLFARRLSMQSEEAIRRHQPAPVRFFLLSRTDADAPVRVDSGDTLSDLPTTPMETEFLQLYNDEQRAFAAPSDD